MFNTLTSGFISTPSTFNVITVNAPCTLFTYLSVLTYFQSYWTVQNAKLNSSNIIAFTPVLAQRNNFLKKY